MKQSIEATWLTNNWNRDFLMKYNRQWIAVLGEKIVANSESFRAVNEQTIQLEEFREGQLVGPLFAFVHLGRLQ
ncbi:MAG: hypothetical protein ABIN67_13240 [Ferruginibacter sp.]